MAMCGVEERKWNTCVFGNNRENKRGNKGRFDDSIQRGRKSGRKLRAATSKTRWRPSLFHGERRCDSIAICGASLYRGLLRREASQFAASH
jgi:hypothetical protein